MQASDAADQIAEALEEEREEKRIADQFRKRAAIVIALLAMLLAVSSLGGDNATKEAINNNILASDTWAFYQAKNIRQTANQIAASELESMLAVHGPNLQASVQQDLQRKVERHQATVARYESEPDPSGDVLKGEGKKELTARAKQFEEKRDHALKQDPNFDYSTALFQIAIVLGSVAILASSWPILFLAMGVGSVATLLMFNGFLLLFDLPFLG
jgi:hypothetical protein